MEQTNLSLTQRVDFLLVDVAGNAALCACLQIHEKNSPAHRTGINILGRLTDLAIINCSHKTPVEQVFFVLFFFFLDTRADAIFEM